MESLGEPPPAPQPGRTEAASHRPRGTGRVPGIGGSPKARWGGPAPRGSRCRIGSRCQEGVPVLVGRVSVPGESRCQEGSRFPVEVSVPGKGPVVGGFSVPQRVPVPGGGPGAGGAGPGTGEFPRPEGSRCRGGGPGAGGGSRRTALTGTWRSGAAALLPGERGGGSGRPAGSGGRARALLCPECGGRTRPFRSAPPRPARGRHRQGEHGHGHGGSGAAAPGGSRPPRGERDARPQPTLPPSPKSPQNSPYPRPRMSLASTSVQGCSGRLATLGLGVCEGPRMSRGYPQEWGGARRTGRGAGSWRGRGGRRALPASCPGSINLPGESQPGETHHCLQDPQKPAGPICSALASPAPCVPPRLGDVAARSWQLESAHLPLSLPQFPSLARCCLQHGHTTPPHCRT